jgi:hypothetical protein
MVLVAAVYINKLTITLAPVHHLDFLSQMYSPYYSFLQDILFLVYYLFMYLFSSLFILPSQHNFLSKILMFHNSYFFLGSISEDMIHVTTLLYLVEQFGL